MPASLPLMSLDGQPMLMLGAWSFLLGLIPILPGSAAAMAHAVWALARRLRKGPSGADGPVTARRPNPGGAAMSPATRRHRAAFFF
jgi:hypothetical protein